MDYIQQQMVLGIGPQENSQRFNKEKQMNNRQRKKNIKKNTMILPKMNSFS